MKYEIFFFKENTRAFDIDALISFLLEQEYMELINGDDKVSIVYDNQLISLQYCLNFTKMSRVPDISRVSAKYLDLDFYIELDTMLPMFKLDIIIKNIEKMCSKFNFLIYNVLFEDVSLFKRELIEKSYDLVRRGYKENFPVEYAALNYVSKDRLEGFYKYILEAKAIKEYYNNKYLFCKTYYMRSMTLNKMLFVAELNLNSATILPPFIDVIVLEINGTKEKFEYSSVLPLIDKYLKDFPGFIGRPKIVEEKMLKKIRKITNKMKVTPLDNDMKFVTEESLIDF